MPTDPAQRAIEAMSEAYAKATPGEWGEWGEIYGYPKYICCHHEGEQRVLLTFNQHFPSRGDWTFITTAKNNTPTLLAHVAALTAENAALRASLADAKAEGERMREALDAISDGTCCQTNHAPECCNCAAQRAAAALASGGQAGN